MQAGKFYIGIDWATDKHALCVTDANGRVLKERCIPNDSSLFEIIAALINGASTNEVLIAIETRRLVIVEALVARGFRVFTINPKQSERFRDRFSPAGVKDDRLDARVLASSLRTDFELFREVEHEDRAQVRLRNATRLRETMQAQFREVSNRLRDVVMSSIPLLLKLCNGADEKWFWELLALTPNAEAARLVTDAKIAEVLGKHRIRRLSVSDVRNVLDSGHLSAAPAVSEAAHWQAHLLIEQLQLLSSQQRAVDRAVTAALHERRALEREAGPTDVDIIMSAPGFAEQTTSVLLAEAGGAVARRALDELRSVCGVAPVTKSSGKPRKKSKWTKPGANLNGAVLMRQAVNIRLRNAVHHAGTAASRNPRFAPIYARLRAKGASHARAVRGVVDRLLNVIIAMLRSGTLYDGTRLAPKA